VPARGWTSRRSPTPPWLRTLALAGFVSLPLSVASAGCSTSARLVASDGSHRLIARDQSGITVILTTETWAGDSYYSDDLAIIHVLIANMSPEPVLIAPGDFQLRDHRGFRYVLFDTGGAFQAVSPDEDPYAQAEIPYDPGRSRDFESLRTDDGELGRLALPWGVLLPGTQMRGYIYFADVRATANHATLTWHAQTPDHRPLASFGFDFHVSRQ
jgi:hypothetical protein